MAGAVARGRALLQAPVAFDPKPQPRFPVHYIALAFSTGFALAFALFIGWLLNLDEQ